VASRNEHEAKENQEDERICREEKTNFLANALIANVGHQCGLQTYPQKYPKALTPIDLGRMDCENVPKDQSLATYNAKDGAGQLA
jgi:hypothetical protein